MRVTRNHPDQLILSDTPWFIAIMLSLFILVFVGVGVALVLDGIWAGLIFALGGGGIGAVVFVAFVRRVQVIFDVSSDTITIRRRSVLGYSEVQHKLSNCSGAVLEHTASSKGGTLYPDK